MSNNRIKVALGMKIQKGAFGGGNQFGKSLVKYLANHNVDIVFSLDDEDIDIILVTETRKWLKSCAFGSTDALRYLIKKPETLIVFRVNECDERKRYKIKILDRLILETAKISDKVVFISSWLENLFINKIPKSKLKEKSIVIHNGADLTIFNREGYKKWDKNTPLKIVTHHWGGNWFKGFDIYLLLDSLIQNKYKNKIEFTYIGNVPQNVSFKNTKVVAPKSGQDLAKEIKKSHIYLTASVNEPAGMHHIEGAMCGLPLLYRNSGAVPEYCQGYGISFDGPKDFENSLTKVMDEYDYWADQVCHYQNTAPRMCENYYNSLIDLLKNKKNILNKRNYNKWKPYYHLIAIELLEILVKLREILFRLKNLLFCKKKNG